jgi:hypothetical protein
MAGRSRWKARRAALCRVRRRDGDAQQHRGRRAVSQNGEHRAGHVQAIMVRDGMARGAAVARLRRRPSSRARNGRV